ncbi:MULTISPECIES: flavin reductase family protein [Gammaproteobacteria]|uniref:flavin reductase family protein n=1 Tax=Gammaproteobacteria TaxID=1236 RepID=UPI000DD00FC6|nr:MULTISPECIES: flavin reductase family protein [Gammaproteobacteria]RTE87263.1 flavin reductase family protein [Aliidiomarina sp. B3213]TCZ92950.1 flavin reductase family protein [Lysobacter sp. N42]
MLIDFSEYSSSQRYHIMTQTIIPRPIAWVLTQHEQGHYNIAPFSYFTAVSSDPALIAFSVGNKDGDAPKDTKANLVEGSLLVVHIPNVEQAQSVTDTAKTLPAEQSELDVAEIELVDFEDFALPRIDKAPVALACRVHQKIQIKGAPQTLIMAEIVKVYVDDAACNVTEVSRGGETKERLEIDAQVINPLARLGAANYAGLTAPFKIKRPD